MMEAFAMMLLFAWIVLLAVYLPPSLGEPANPLEPLIPIFPEWYFLSVFGFLQFWTWGVGPITAKVIGVLAPGLFFLVLLLLPFFDRGEKARPYQRPRGIAIAIVLALLLVYLSYYSIYVEEVYFPSQEPDKDTKLLMLKAGVLLIFAAGAAIYFALKKRATQLSAA